jgi:hypothetical protein
MHHLITTAPRELGPSHSNALPAPNTQWVVPFWEIPTTAGDMAVASWAVPAATVRGAVRAIAAPCVAPGTPISAPPLASLPGMPGEIMSL